MNEILKDILKESSNNIFSDNRLRFIFKLALHSRNYRVNISDLLFKLNGIQTNLEELRDDVYFKTFVEKSNSYLKVLKSNDRRIKIELTEDGVKLAELLEYDSSNLKKNTLPLKVKNVTVHLIMIAVKVILIVLALSIIGLFIAPVFYEELRDPLLYILAFTATLYAVLSYFKNK